MWKVEQGDDGIRRVWPLHDLRAHDLHEHCWCHPFFTDDGIEVHNSLDGREHHEPIRRQ